MQFTQLFLLHTAVSMYVSAVPSLPGLSQSYNFMLVTNMKGLVSSKGKYCQSDSHYKDFVFPSLNTHSTFNKAEV